MPMLLLTQLTSNHPTVNKIVQKATAFKSKHHVGSKRHTRHSSTASMDDIHQIMDERTIGSDLSSLIASGINGLADLDAKGIIKEQ